jgi:hypothetical protein
MGFDPLRLGDDGPRGLVRELVRGTRKRVGGEGHLGGIVPTHHGDTRDHVLTIGEREVNHA